MELNEYINSVLQEMNIDIQQDAQPESNSIAELRNDLGKYDDNDDKNRITLRFSSASWFKNIGNMNISIIGAGGISSWTALFLSRMNPASISIFDKDVVESVNLGGQFFNTSDINCYKSTVLKSNIKKFSDYNKVESYIYNVSNNEIKDILKNSDIVICGVDNMKTRKIVFDNWKYIDDKPLLIDGRLSANMLQILLLHNDTSDFVLEEYNNKWLFDDMYAHETICSYKQTTHIASMIGSYICNIITAYVDNSYIPYFIEYDSDTMILETKY